VIFKRTTCGEESGFALKIFRAKFLAALGMTP